MREIKMKKGKSKSSSKKKSATQYSESTFFKDFVNMLSKFCAFILLVIIVLFFITGKAMVETNQFFSYIHLDKELAFYMHQQLTIPFCVCMILHIFPSLTK